MADEPTPPLEGFTPREAAMVCLLEILDSERDRKKLEDRICQHFPVLIVHQNQGLRTAVAEQLELLLQEQMMPFVDKLQKRGHTCGYMFD